MNNNDKIQNYNLLVLNSLSIFLNNEADSITKEMVEELSSTCSFSKEEAFRVLLAGALGVYDEKDIMDGYMKDMVRLLDAAEYRNDPYYQRIKLSDIKVEGWKIEEKKYKPYEAFVYNDLVEKPDGRLIPQIGFFAEEYRYPCIFQNDREWMLITPNEIETMRKPINAAYGDVATYGLGLGYYAFMTSEKENVRRVTIIEKDKAAIELFTEWILPQFPNKDKIQIVEADAFEYAAKKIKHDFVFADIWHDPTNGIDIYLKLKEFERMDTKYEYWIEDTIKCYI